MRKKILIMPIQTGYAHLMRSIAVAEELVKNHDVSIIIHQKKHKLFQLSPSINIINTDEDPYDDPNQVLSQYLDNQKGKNLIDLFLNIVKKEKPDLILTDVHPAGMVAAWITNTKQVMMINSHALPFSSGFPGWFDRTDTWSKKLLSVPIEFFLDFWKQYFVGRVLKLVQLYRLKPLSCMQIIRTLPILIPESKDYNLLRRYLPNNYFINPIVYEKIEKRDLKLEQKLLRLTKGKKTIFLTFGGTGFGKKLLIQLIKMLTKDYFVIFATGNILDINDVKNNNNLYINKFIPGFSAAKIADIVVSHGSYGTITQALHWGKPVVCMPFNLDQVYHGLKVQERKVGKTLITVSPYLFLMDFERQQKVSEAFNPDKIYKAVKDVLNDPAYVQNAKKYSYLFQDLDGARNASKIINKILAL